MDGEEFMIARSWTGETPKAKAAEYQDLMRRGALPDYRATPGNAGAWCLTRDRVDTVEFTMLTFWDDLDAVRRFAGDDYQVAKYYDFDPDFLVAMAPHVTHYEVDAGA
jgi:hypothetical protein